MHVLVAGDFPEAPPLAVGGIQAVTWQLAESLARSTDHVIDVYSREVRARGAAGRTRTARYDGISATYAPAVRWLPVLVRSWTTDAGGVIRHIHGRQPDVVHAHGQRGYAVGALLSGIPTVVTVHGIYAHEKSAAARPAPHAALRESGYRSMEAWVLRRARHIVVISPYVRAFVEPRTSATLHDIPNPIAPEFFAIEPAPERSARLLSIGELTPRKRPDLLLRAFAAILRERPEARLRLVGGSARAPKPYGRSVRSLAESLGIAGSVDFLGRVPQDDLHHEYRKADLVLHAASEESSPMTLAQALAAGVPAVAFDIPGVRHLVLPGRTGSLADDGEPTALARRALELLSSEERLVRLSHEAKAFARHSFSADAVANRTARVYEQARAEGAGRAGVRVGIRGERRRPSTPRPASGRRAGRDHGGQAVVEGDRRPEPQSAQARQVGDEGRDVTGPRDAGGDDALVGPPGGDQDALGQR